MKKLLPFASLVLVTPLVAAAWPQGHENQAKPEAPQAQAADGATEARIAALETALAAEKKRNDETRALLEQTLAYLDKQAKGAQSMLDVLSQSEKQGFTVGENFHSRETLVAGLRAYWTDAQNGVPKPPPPPAAPKAAPPARPQRTPRQ